nr:SH3 domain-containing protein C23A1.17-like [Aegilops tauschii subsp. strangulata]
MKRKPPANWALAHQAATHRAARPAHPAAHLPPLPLIHSLPQTLTYPTHPIPPPLSLAPPSPRSGRAAPDPIVIADGRRRLAEPNAARCRPAPLTPALVPGATPTPHLVARWTAPPRLSIAGRPRTSPPSASSSSPSAPSRLAAKLPCNGGENPIPPASLSPPSRTSTVVLGHRQPRSPRASLPTASPAVAAAALSTPATPVPCPARRFAPPLLMLARAQGCCCAWPSCVAAPLCTPPAPPRPFPARATPVFALPSARWPPVTCQPRSGHGLAHSRVCVSVCLAGCAPDHQGLLRTNKEMNEFKC